jgi:hypothetical protein
MEVTMINKTSATLSLIALLVVAPAFAQRPLNADIPFDFTVGKTHMSAGKYSVNFDIPGTVRIVRDDRTAACVVHTMGVQATKTPEAGKLVFNRYGDSYFLSQIWSPGYDSGRALQKSKAEVEIARTVDRVQSASIPASTKGVSTPSQ